MTWGSETLMFSSGLHDMFNFALFHKYVAPCRAFVVAGIRASGSPRLKMSSDFYVFGKQKRQEGFDWQTSH